MSDSPIAAGPTKLASRAPRSRTEAPAAARMDHVDAINQLFGIMDAAYPSQFQHVFADGGKLTMAKQLWRRHLACFEPAAIVRAGELACAVSAYVPSLHYVLKMARSVAGDGALPEPYLGYQEACMAAPPKRQHAWSHIAVYHAGDAVGWHVLATQPEARSWPLFKSVYQELCALIQQGEALPAIPEAASAASGAASLPGPSMDDPLQREQLRKQLRTLRRTLR